MMPQSLKFYRSQRLLEAGQYKAVFDARCCKRSDRVQLYALSNTVGQARLGVVVGKKQLRTAVARNRAKRQVREVFRLNQAALPNVDIVVRVNCVVPVQELGQFRIELLRLFQRAKQCLG